MIPAITRLFAITCRPAFPRRNRLWGRLRRIRTSATAITKLT